MKEVYKTKEGTYTDSVTKVYLSDDGTEYSSDRGAKTHDTLGFAPKPFPSELVIQGEVFKYPELDPWSNELHYTMKKGWAHESISFSIEKDGSYIFKEFTAWDRCGERDVYSRSEDTPGINGKEVNECKDINFTDVEYACFESLFNLC